MHSRLVISILILSALGTGTQQRPVRTEGRPLLVADAFYWAGPEGNIGAEITGKFQSEKQLEEYFTLSQPIGMFNSKKKPVHLVQWTLRDVLVSADFNAGGSVATWRLSGPKPLVLAHLASLKRKSEDKSLFYDFGYRFVDFKPSVG